MTLALLGIGVIIGALAMLVWCWFFDCCATNTTSNDNVKTNSNNPVETTTDKSSDILHDSTDSLANKNEPDTLRSNISASDSNLDQHASSTEPSAMQNQLNETVEQKKDESPANTETIAVDIEELKDNLPKATTSADDLKEIKGIGPVLEKTLNDLGITTFRQVALLNNRQAQEVAIAIKTFPDRMHRDNWLPQAADLHLDKYKEKVK